MADEWIVVSTADRESDVRLVLYGLRLRGIRAESRRTNSRQSPWVIVAPSGQAETARRVIDDVWDAVFESETAITPQGTCPFCGYEVLGLPRNNAGQLPCPECGVDLRSAGARLAVRDGKRPRNTRRP